MADSATSGTPSDPREYGGTGDGSGDEAHDAGQEEPPEQQQLSSHRAVARQEIQQLWKERREQQQQSSKKKNGTVGGGSSENPTAGSRNSNKQQQRGRSHQQQQQRRHRGNHGTPLLFPSLCSIVWKAWEQQQKPPISQHQQPAPPAAGSKKSTTAKKAAASSSSSTTGTASSSSSTAPSSSTFPSVLNILQANALFQQVTKSLQQDEEEEDGDADANRSNVPDGAGVATGNGSKMLGQQQQHLLKPLQKHQLSILSNEKNFYGAIEEMAETRSRAFWMVDVATVVKRVVALQEEYPRIQFVHHAHNELLLQVLVDNGIQLVTDNRQDIRRAEGALATVSRAPTIAGSGGAVKSSAAVGTKSSRRGRRFASFRDSTRLVGKPDGYVRRFLLANHSDKVLVVDGKDEVVRIANTIRRLQERERKCRRRSSDDDAGESTISCNGFVLRLEGGDVSRWTVILNETVQAIKDIALSITDSDIVSANANINNHGYRLTGVSFDVSSEGASEHCTVYDIDEQTLVRQDTALHVLDMLIDLRSREEQSSGADDGSVLRVDLTGFQCFPLEESWVQWWRMLLRERDQNIQVTFDCSNLLLPPAGALCTRVIGVRTTTKDGTGEEGAGATEHRHYYIDDGCYGSLSQAGSGINSGGDKALRPLPLLATRERQENLKPKLGDAAEVSEGSPKLICSTVWGPTCDGLDKVCQDIPLPELHRDDWLVFFPSDETIDANSNNNTAFNGFDPPDTAYCVLGYFPK